MLRVLSVVCAVLVVAVAALAFEVRDAHARLDALEASANAHAAAAPHLGAAHAWRTNDDDDDDAPGTLARAASATRPARTPIADATTLAASNAPNDGRTGGAGGAGGKAIEERVPDLVRGELQRIDEEKREERDARQRQRIGRELDKLGGEVALTDDQRAKLQDMLDAELVEVRQVFADARDTGDLSGVRDKIAAVRAKTDENAGAVLDDDKQKSAYQQMRSDERQRFAGAFGGGNNAGGISGGNNGANNGAAGGGGRARGGGP